VGAFAGPRDLTQTAGSEFHPFQDFACGKMLDAAHRGGRLIAVVFFNCLHQEVNYA